MTSAHGEAMSHPASADVELWLCKIKVRWCGGPKLNLISIAAAR